MTLKGEKQLSFPATSVIRSFHRAANSILFSCAKPNKSVLMKLLYTNCVPIIMYACAVRIFSASEMHRCHVAINNAIKKIYSFAIWQSIRDIRTSNGYKSIYEIFAFTRKKFMEAALSSSNQVVAHLVSELPIDL